MILFLKILQFLLRIIFYLPAAMAFSAMYSIARIIYAIAAKTKFKKTVIENIRMILPDSKAEQIADEALKNVSCSILEILCVPFFRKKHFESFCKWEGLENLSAALQDKKGALLVTIHAGNYETIPAALTHKGYRLNTVLRASEDPIFEFVNLCRSVGGTKLINIVNQDMYKESMKALGNNEIVALLADTGALESRRKFLKFFGREVPVATGWLTLAQRARCPVVLLAVRREGIKNIATFYNPFVVTRENHEEVMQRVASTFENFIRKYPQEWLMFLNEYETRRMVSTGGAGG